MGVKPFVTSDYMTLVVGVNAQMRGVLKRAADLTVSEYRVLATLLRIGSDATPCELATLLKLSVTSITETAAALVTHGYLERRRGVQDRRLVHLVLTPSGSEALTSADAALSRYIVKLWEPLDEDQRRVIADSSMQIDCIFKQGLDRDRRAFVSVARDRGRHRAAQFHTVRAQRGVRYGRLPHRRT